jgi:hypothetical protein
VNRHAGLVDGDLLKVGAAVTVDLCVEVREQTSLQKRVVGEVDTSDNVADLVLQTSQYKKAWTQKDVLTITCSVSAK